MPVGHKTRKQIDQLERQQKREREREKRTPVVQSFIIWCLYYKTKHNVFFMKQIQLYMAIKK